MVSGKHRSSTKIAPALFQTELYFLFINSVLDKAKCNYGVLPNSNPENRKVSRFEAKPIARNFFWKLVLNL